MADVLRSGSGNCLDCRGGTFRPKSAATLLLGASLLIPTVSLAGQASLPAQAKKGPQANSSPAPAEPASPPPAQIWLPPLQAPAHEPAISWDGKLLTIDADNSSLADVLLGIRSRTGATIEMPASTRAERIAIHLGPAPIREVLSSLLYGTDFNYVIQASEDDAGALGKVILTARDGDQKSSDDALAGDARANKKVRLMPGYAAPGKRDFEVAHSRALEDSSSTVGETSAESASAGADQTPVTAETDAATNAQADDPPAPAKADATDSAPSTEGNSLTATGQPISGNAPGTISGTGSGEASGSGGTPNISQMEQNLQRMYQQRQQLQAQQNHTAPPPAQ